MLSIGGEEECSVVNTVSTRVEREHQQTEGAVQHKDVAGSYQLQQQQPLRQDNEKRTTLSQRQQVQLQTS